MYKSIHEAPKGLRHLGGHPLNVEQINQIVNSANKSKKPFSEALYKAKEGFKSKNKVDSGLWRAK